MSIWLNRHEKERLDLGIRFCLVRSRAYGSQAGILEAGGTNLFIFGVEERPLGFIRDHYYAYCGFESPQAFVNYYKRAYLGGRRFNPNRKRIVHWVKPHIPVTMVYSLDNSTKKRMDVFIEKRNMFVEEQRPLIWNDPGRIGMAALDYCMGTECPKIRACKRYFMEAVKFPHQMNVKVMPTVPYHKGTGECDYFIRK